MIWELSSQPLKLKQPVMHHSLVGGSRIDAIHPFVLPPSTRFTVFRSEREIIMVNNFSWSHLLA